MNVFLTGGAGYIGSHAALSLLDSGHDVHIIDNLSTGNETLIPKDAEFTNCNINDEGVISDLIQSNKFDLLMHFAGFIQVEESVQMPEKYFKNNTDDAIKLFNTCKKNGLNKIVFSSTAAAYGSVSGNKIIDENTNLNPQNPYAESKIKTEKFLLDNKDDFKFVILRYFNVAGADKNLRSGQISKKSTHLIKILSEVAVGKRDHIEIFGNNYDTPDGTAIRDYIHVSDLADLHLEVAKYLLEQLESNLFNCGYGNGFSVLDVINTTNNIYQNKIKYKFSDRRAGDVEKLIAENSKILKYIKWKPKYNDLKEIITSSIRWEEKINASNT
ncbi:MAG: UDP-glucose 4-epimerase GalE [Candidatus Marinimicrobia bacterium]|nr:UDP-glucose 4-epimerase GalE [Candidatus Neomarinimicrobiota bacterium]|tara:strand:- start:3414 stop:4397 length:984 start_codon:yes stop_codon:yes gene_type:complete